jgi:hypothetical protein
MVANYGRTETSYQPLRHEQFHDPPYPAVSWRLGVDVRPLLLTREYRSVSWQDKPPEGLNLFPLLSFAHLG